MCEMCKVCNGDKVVLVTDGKGITSFQPCLNCNMPKYDSTHKETWADLERMLRVCDPTNVNG